MTEFPPVQSEYLLLHEDDEQGSETWHIAWKVPTIPNPPPIYQLREQPSGKYREVNSHAIQFN